jgi:hypothetical protein
MANELSNTWDGIADNWDKWGSPLRPSMEDAIHMMASLLEWNRKRPDPQNAVKVYLLGVTPEIVNLKWPFPTAITAMDNSQGMIQKVWPGDVLNKRRAILGDWFINKMGIPQDIIVADGSFVFYGPASCAELVKIAAETLVPNGLFIARHFIMPRVKEDVSDLMDALKAHKIKNFHSFKFRIGMALQKDFATGVSQKEIYDTIIAASDVVKADFTQSALDVLEFYKDKTNRFFFPTANELKAVLNQKFSSVKFIYPGYEFGESCPTVIAQ